MMHSPVLICGCMAPVVPTRMKGLAPIWGSSATAIDVDGPPMPVDVTSTGEPGDETMKVVNSLLDARGEAAPPVAVATARAIGSTRPGSPGIRTVVAPFIILLLSCKWYRSAT